MPSLIAYPAAVSKPARKIRYIAVMVIWLVLRVCFLKINSNLIQAAWNSMIESWAVLYYTRSDHGFKYARVTVGQKQQRFNDNGAGAKLSEETPDPSIIDVHRG
jgi:hypothetical protein